MRDHTEHFSNFLKGHPPLGIFIWINEIKISLYFFPFILSTKALYHPENRLLIIHPLIAGTNSTPPGQGSENLV